MLVFKKLTLNDIDALHPYFEYSHSRICDNSMGTAVMWRCYFDTYYAFYNSTLILRMHSLSGDTVFSLPLGEDIYGALEATAEYCKSNNLPFVINAVTLREKEMISHIFSFEETHDEDWDDYLYNITDISGMEGRKYSGQRNHINYFSANNPGWSFEKIDSTNINRLKAFYENYCASSETSDETLQKEHEMVSEVINNYDIYRMQGGFISLADKTIVAMAIGESVGDTLFEHIEKALPSVRGAYQLIAREFARNFSKDGILYLNREEDMGREGLRKSKMSYHPCEKIKKYTLYVKT
ncbi:MAG: DUF2156 domain-containing protein [Ruminococcaceae bacterium]|nr:DUF2156 domain-containing protein [Oscillospiraceae bacterium]